MKKKQYRSPLMASIHETADGLHNAGLMDERTLREFDELCFARVRTVISLPPRAWATFVKRLDSPARANERLRRTMKTPAQWA